MTTVAHADSLYGPEWGWPLGYFLRAYLYFDMKAGAGKTVGFLSPLLTTIRLTFL